MIHKNNFPQPYLETIMKIYKKFIVKMSNISAESKRTPFNEEYEDLYTGGTYQILKILVKQVQLIQDVFLNSTI